MIVAKGTVIVKGKEFGPGQEVKGLSKTDIKWMKQRGFIEEKSDKKKPDKEEEKPENDVQGGL